MCFLGIFITPYWLLTWIMESSIIYVTNEYQKKSFKPWRLNRAYLRSWVGRVAADFFIRFTSRVQTSVSKSCTPHHLGSHSEMAIEKPKAILRRGKCFFANRDSKWCGVSTSFAIFWKSSSCRRQDRGYTRIEIHADWRRWIKSSAKISVHIRVDQRSRLRWMGSTLLKRGRYRMPRALIALRAGEALRYNSGSYWPWVCRLIRRDWEKAKDTRVATHPYQECKVPKNSSLLLRRRPPSESVASKRSTPLSLSLGEKRVQRHLMQNANIKMENDNVKCKVIKFLKKFWTFNCHFELWFFNFDFECRCGANVSQYWDGWHKGEWWMPWHQKTTKDAA